MNIALLGFGFVGQGVWHILQSNREQLALKLGLDEADIQLKVVGVRDCQKARNNGLPESIPVTDDIGRILADPSIELVIEAIGGEHPAYQYIHDALVAGKHVVTANKEVIAKHQQVLFQLAHDHQVILACEAAVGGSIPLIRGLRVGFAANKIQSVMGILNGTTNYMLTRMLADSMPYDDALKQAQALGFAEADPTMDVSGMDVAYKVIILAGVAFHVDIPIEAMPVEGIESIQLADMLHAQDMGYVVKLIGAITATDNGLAVRVCPMLLPNTHAMATVNNEVNALFLHGDCVGDAMMVGKGAGGIPTASAILSDVVAIGASTSMPVRLEPAQLVPLCDQETAMYMRLSVQDHVGVLEQVTHVLSQAGVSLKTVVQKNQGDEASIILITHPVKESVIQGLQLNELPVVLRIDAMLRVV